MTDWEENLMGKSTMTEWEKNLIALLRERRSERRAVGEVSSARDPTLVIVLVPAGVVLAVVLWRAGAGLGAW